MKNLGFLIISMAFMFPSFIFGNDIENILQINGVVYEVPDAIEGCNIIVHQNGTPTIFTQSNDSGFYSIKLALGNEYIIEFSHPSYVTKKLSVDTKNSSPEQSYQINEVMVDLFQELEKKQDILDLNQPIAKIVYNTANNKFEYDMTYNNKIQKKVQQLWNTIYGERIVRDENYKEAMVQADSSFSIKDYPVAKAGYVNALSYRPMAKEPKRKIKYIDSLLVDEVDRVLETHDKEANSIAQPMASSIDPVEVYSDKMIEDVYHLGKKVVTNRKLNKNERPLVVHYRKVETSFGTYYFRNNTPITAIVWEIETEKEKQ